MTLTEFYYKRFEIFTEDLNRYRPQRDSNTGKKFIYQPFESLEEYKEQIENDLQENPYEEELEVDITTEEEQKLFEDLFKDFELYYNYIVETRKQFERL